MKHLSSILLLGLFACTKEPKKSDPIITSDNQEVILSDFNQHIAQAVYFDLSNGTSALNDAAIAFVAEQNAANLEQCRTAWKQARESWEKSEAFLFGPVATENIDPRIDTWPVNFVDLEGELSASNAFTSEYVNAMQDALKGFHPIEYLIFGLNGDKTVAEFTPRQCEYLTALTANLYELTSDLNNRWNGTSPYGWHLTHAGASSIFYPTRKAAFEEIALAMIGISEEVANGKLREPFLAQNANLEESPFAKNSIRDFYNNIVGIEMVYLGQYEANGYGMEDFVRTYNLSIDNDIKQKMSAAKSALSTITDPFGTAIITQPIQVQNAIDAINALGESLEDGLLPLIELHVTN